MKRVFAFCAGFFLVALALGFASKVYAQYAADGDSGAGEQLEQNANSGDDAANNPSLEGAKEDSNQGFDTANTDVPVKVPDSSSSDNSDSNSNSSDNSDSSSSDN